MPTPAPTTVRRLPEAYPVDITYVAGVDGQGDDVIERAGTAFHVDVRSPDGEQVLTVSEKDARHNLIPLGWRPVGADDAPTARRTKEAARG